MLDLADLAVELLKALAWAVVPVGLLALWGWQIWRRCRAVPTEALERVVVEADTEVWCRRWWNPEDVAEARAALGDKEDGE